MVKQPVLTCGSLAAMAVIGLLTGALSPSGLAQESRGIEEIVVTGSRLRR